MQRPPPPWEIQIVRSSRELCVVARVVSPEAKFAAVARFSSNLGGFVLSLNDGGQRSELTSEVLVKHPALHGILRLIGDEADASGPQHRALLECLFRSVQIYVRRMSTTVPRPRWGRVLRDARIERAIELLNRDLSRRWTVETLAKAVGLSRPVLARKFIEVLGLSPMKYLTRRRMQVAAALLFASDAGVAEVAARVGYQSEFAFSRAFRREFQVPPGQYRERSTTVMAHAVARAA